EWEQVTHNSSYLLFASRQYLSIECQVLGDSCRRYLPVIYALAPSIPSSPHYLSRERPEVVMEALLLPGIESVRMALHVARAVSSQSKRFDHRAAISPRRARVCGSRNSCSNNPV